MGPWVDSLRVLARTGRDQPGRDELIRVLPVMLMVGLFGLTGVAAVTTGTEPRTPTVTEPESAEGGAAVAQRRSGTGSSQVAEAREAETDAGLISGGRIVVGGSGSVTVGTYRHHSAAYWNWRYRTMRHLAYLRHKRIRQLKRTLMSSPSVSEAINLAGATYGNIGLLWSLARCETGGTFNPGAKNPTSDASGLMEFLPSTFASTPYRGLSLWSP
jgi:hypothetical protein